MPVFAYRALTAAGHGRRGVIDAESTRAAWQALRSRGIFPTELAEDRASAPRAGRRRVAAGELAAATRALATLVTAGVPVTEALAAVGEETEQPVLANALTHAHARLREGVPLADALGASPVVFAPLFCDVVRAGELSGALPAVLLRLADHAEASAATRARLRAALTYPVVMVLATLAVLGFLLAWVVPQVTHLFAESGAQLPLATRALVAITHLVAISWWIVLPLGVGAALGIAAWARTDAGRERIDATLLQLPLVAGLVRKVAAARLARTLATLLAGGVPLETALGIAIPVMGNRALAAAAARAREAVREGQPLAAALAASRTFPPLLIRLAAVGERGGSLADTLERAAVAHEGEVERVLAALVALVEPALILTMGGVVLVLVAAILLPLFELNALVR
ncbi:MAG TPA: type II secretion system F family protein [Candidatus Nitrosopolaris sp.]|nr:type II secretion system F family protein [Candidatus Nitrosopolaris sp.]